MKTESEIAVEIKKYSDEIEEMQRIREHCASWKWWSVVAELKKVENVRSRDKRQLEAILNE